MNGAQDLGGQHGFGPVAPQAGEPRFHAEWEKRALALTLSAGAMGHWTIDESRAARESLPPADYLSSSYYEIWIKALEKLLVSHGFVTSEELAEGRSLSPSATARRVLHAADVAPVLAKGAPADRDPGGQAPRFQPGESVRTRAMNPKGHTRLPRYARDKSATVETVQGFHMLPDESALGNVACAQWLYTIVFDAAELWGEDAEPGTRVSVDAWESYLVAD